MRNTKIKTISVAVAAALVTGCSSSGGASAPATAIPLATCAANTVCGEDAVTLAHPATIAANGAVTVTGSATKPGAAKFTVKYDVVNGYSATMSGGVNTSVPALTILPGGELAGTAANGQNVVMVDSNFNVPPTAFDNTQGLTYSNYGAWQMTTLCTSCVGTVTYTVWAGGRQFTTAMPTTGSATYAGVTGGGSLVNAGGVFTPYSLSGNLALTASFTNTGGTIAGNITGITATNYGVPSGTFNDIALAGTITGNAFTGTATAGAVPAGTNPAAIAANTTGTTAGHFYGPAANEITGVWSMSTAAVQALGSFGAKQ